MKEDERITIINALRIVDRAFLSIDSDRSQCKTLAYLLGV